MCSSSMPAGDRTAGRDMSDMSMHLQEAREGGQTNQTKEEKNKENEQHDTTQRNTDKRLTFPTSNNNNNNIPTKEPQQKHPDIVQDW